MIASNNILSCNFTHPPLKSLSSPANPSLSPPKSLISLSVKSNCSLRLPKISPYLLKQKKGRLQILSCSSFNNQTPQDPPLVSSSSEEEDELIAGCGKNNGEGRGWTTSFLLFAFWDGLMYYVFVLAPNQTPVTDMNLLKKLLNLKGDDGFEMNQVIVALWYIMGLWPLLYSMLLLPTGRSSKSKIPVWPFVSLSFVGEPELRRWPLNFLESKLTAGGMAIVVHAFSSGGDAWQEFYQYFRESKFIHVMSIDFGLLSIFAPFWVYNDMTARKWDGKGSSWLLPLSLIPFLGPALYLLLRPSLSIVPEALAPQSDET
ncbi:hypothetical protein OROMI_020137 [Orobanche minor]